MKPKFRHRYVDDICMKTQCIKQTYEILHVSNKINYENEQIIECIYMPITGIIEFELCQFGRGVLLEFVKIRRDLSELRDEGLNI
jgi:hypothetical protein